MRRLYRRLTALVLILALMTGLSGCGSRKADNGDNIPESTGGRELVRSAEADDVFSLNCNMTRSFNPLIATNHSNQLVCGLVYENMVELNNSFEVIPNIIIDWSYTDDGKNWTFTLDTTHTFHDGTPVTGKDLRYSLERAIHADRYSGRFSSFQGIAYSEDSLVITLGIGDTDFIKLLNIPVIQSGSYDEPYPMGSGPYMYNEDYTELVPYEGYFDRLKQEVAAAKEAGEDSEVLAEMATEPPLDVIYLKQYTDAEEIINAFENGTIDLVINDPSSYTNLGYASSNEVHTYATTNLHYVMFNQESTICKDSTFRYAMNYAFDRSYLVTLLNGNGVASAVPMYPTCSNYPTALANSLAYNIDTCKIVLANAGVRDYDEDGKMEYLNAATPVELTFIVCSDSSAKAGVVNRFASDMEELGIKINVRELTWWEYKEALVRGNFDMMYGEMKLRANFDLTELLKVHDTELDPQEDDNGYMNVINVQYLSNLNFSRCKDTVIMDYMNYYLSSGIDKKAAYKSFCDYITGNGYLISIGFEQQQIISHRGAIKGMDANYGNPVWNFSDWIINIG